MHRLARSYFRFIDSVNFHSKRKRSVYVRSTTAFTLTLRSMQVYAKRIFAKSDRDVLELLRATPFNTTKMLLSAR